MDTWTSMKQFFSRGEPAQKFISVSEAKLDMLVEVEFCDPRTIGIQVPGHLTCTRFNPEEFDDRKFKGFISFIGNWEGGPRYGKYIVFKTTRLNKEREFLLLAQEIKTMRIID